MQYQFIQYRSILITMALLVIQMNGIGQNKTVTTFSELNPQPVYIGGGIVLGGGSGSFQIGLNPELVKTYNEYIDLGAAVNVYYASYRTISSDNNEYKLTNTQLGLGAFVRAWPLEAFFLQLQPEYNWTFSSGNNYTQGTSGRSQVSAPSLLAGIGYGQRYENGFSYFSIMYDLIDAQQSPYRMGQASPQPIFRAGFGIPLRIAKKKSG